MPMRSLDIANTPAFEHRDSAGIGPEHDLTEYGQALVEDLNAAQKVVLQSDYGRSTGEIWAEMNKIVFLQIRRERAEQAAKDKP